MKLSLTIVIILLLMLGTVACSDSPATQNESERSIEGDSTLSKIALEVATIT